MPDNYSTNKRLRLCGNKLLGLMALVGSVQFASAPALASPLSEQHPGSTESQARSVKPPPGGSSAVLQSLLQQAPLPTVDAPLPGEMLVYSPRRHPDLSTFVSLGTPEALGGQVLTGNPQLFGRIDFQQGNKTAGLFMATTGLIRVTFPFTEHATIVAGWVTLTDETGKTRTLLPGDSYFIRQGAVILWDVKAPYVIKSFFNITEPAAP